MSTEELGPGLAYTLDQLSRAINVPVRTLRFMRQQGTGPKTKLVGRRVVVLREDAERWLRSLPSGDRKKTG